MLLVFHRQLCLKIIKNLRLARLETLEFGFDTGLDMELEGFLAGRVRLRFVLDVRSFLVGGGGFNLGGRLKRLDKIVGEANWRLANIPVSKNQRSQAIV